MSKNPQKELSPSQIRLEYEEYLNELKTQFQSQENHKECEISWKLSSRGINRNKRLMHIFGNYLFYYSKVPKNFSSTQNNNPPKAGIRLNDISTSFSLNDDFNKKTKFLMMEFPSARLIRFKGGKGNPLFDLSKANLLEKNPIKSNINSKIKWVLSTNPSISLKNSQERNTEEIFLDKLVKYINNNLNAKDSLKNIPEKKSESSENLKNNSENLKKEGNLKENEENKSEKNANEIQNEEAKKLEDNEFKIIKTEEQHPNLTLSKENIPIIENSIPSSQNLGEIIENENKLKEKEDFHENQHIIVQILKEEDSQNRSSLNNEEIKGSFQNEKEKLNKTVNPEKISSKNPSNENNTENLLKNRTARSIHASKSFMIEINHEPFEQLKSEEVISSEKKSEIGLKILRNSKTKEEKNIEKTDQIEIKENLENSKNLENSSNFEISANVENSSNFKKSENFQISENLGNSLNFDNNQQKNENFFEESPGGMQIYDFKETIDDLKDSLIRNAETNKKNNQKLEQIYKFKQEKSALEKPIHSQSSKNSNNWEDLFYETLKEMVNNRLDYIKDMTYGLNLIEILNDFQGFSQSLIKTIINELNLSKSERKFRPMIEKPDIFIYNLQEEGVVIKLTGLNSPKIEDFTTIFKDLGNEFRANRFVLNRIIYNMKKNLKEAYYKVPLCCLIDYMGLRALVYCKSKGINGDKTLVLGFDSKDIYQKNNLLNENIIVSLSNIFAIRKHYVRSSNESVSALESSLISSVEIHQTMNSVKTESDLLQKYIFYLLNATHILPDVFHSNGNFNANRIEKYRPEFIEENLKKPHNPEWVISEPFINEHNEATAFFQIYEKNLEEFVDFLQKKPIFFQFEESDSMNKIAESENLSELLHKKGINMHSLGKLYDMFTHLYLKTMVLNEIVTRVCKRLLRFHLSKSFIKAQEEQMNSSDFIINIQKEFADFFNVLYCKKTKDSQIFWKNAIWPKIESDFLLKLPLEIKENYKLKMNYLIQLFESLGFEVKTSNFSFLKNKKYFLFEDFKEIYLNSRVKSIEISSIECFNLFKSSITKENKPFQKKLYRVFALENQFLLKKSLEFLKIGDYKKATEITIDSNSSLKEQMKMFEILFIAFLALKNTQNALKILDKISEILPFCFEKKHPFFLNFLLRLCEFYLKEDLKEETLFLSKKILKKYEKSIGFEEGFSLGFYVKFIEIYDRFPCINEKIYCLECICDLTQENTNFYGDLIKLHLKEKGGKTKAIETLKKLLEKTKEKKCFSKKSIEDLLQLCDFFKKINEEACSEEILKILLLILKNKSIDFRRFLLSHYLTRVLLMICEGFTEETTSILKEFLTFLEKKKEKSEEFIEKIWGLLKNMSHSEFLEWFKEILSRILLKQDIDEKNQEEETVEAALFLIDRQFLE